MSWVTVIWSMGSGICLVLAGVHLLVWLKSHDSRAHLFFAIATLSAVAVSLIELAMMHAHTPQEHGELLRWLHVPLCSLVISLVWFVRFYLRAGRIWLLWLICAIRLLMLLLNFLMPPVLNFKEITGLHQISFLGEILVVSVGKTNPWLALAEVSGFLFLFFVVGAGITAWRRGDRRQAWVVGGTISMAFVLGVLLSLNLDIVSLPYTASLAFLIIVLGLAYELSVDLINAMQLAKELHISEDRMNMASRAANLGLWEWDIVRDEIWTNAVSRERIGTPEPERVNFKRFLQRVHPGDRDAVRQAAHRTIEQGGELQIEYRLSTPDGGERWLTTRGKVEYDLNRKPLLVRGVTLDITERKLAENALLKSEQLARILLNTTSNLTHLIRKDGTIIDLNDAMANALGGPREELIGTNIFDRFSEGEREKRKAFMISAAAEEKAQRFEDTDRSGKIYDTAIYPVNSPEGKQDQFVIFAHDITELKQSQKALQKTKKKLQEREKLLNEAQRIASVGSWGLDLMTNDLTWSDEIFRIFEMDKEHFGASYEAFLATIHPDDRDVVDRAYKRSLEIREPYKISHRLLLPDGRIKYVQERCETYYNPEGKPLRSVGTVQDMTELIHAQTEKRELQNELAHLNRIMTMNELSVSLAHEINQPLGAIMNNVAALKSICSGLPCGNGEVTEILGDVINDANRAGKIVRKIRSIVKKEDSTCDPEPLDVNAMVNAVIELLQSKFKISDINVQIESPPELPPVLGNRIRLQQVMMNLMTNAAEAMRNSPRKILSVCITHPSNEEITIQISDTGSGIDPDIREHLFEPFHTTKKEGLGIGLRICRSIIEEHGGRIWLQDSSGKGTTFVFVVKTCREVANG